MQTPSITFTVRVNPDDKKRLEALAKNTGRSRSYLAAEAIAEYLATNEWQVAGIYEALASLEKGQVVDHDEVSDWVQSWGSENELPAPQPKGR